MPAPKRILLLEDDAHCAQLLQMYLSQRWPECAIVHVSNKNDYVSALATGNIDIILCDYSLPGFSGPDALAIARQDYPEIPVIFITGAISDDHAVECLKACAVDYILKDRPARLIPAIYRAVELAEANNRRLEHENLINSVDGIVWMADQSSLNFTFVSKQAERILGYPIESWLNDPDFWLNHIHPEDKEMAMNLCRNLTSDQTHPDFEYRMIAADGRVIWLRDIVSVLVKKNRLPQIQGIMMDITRQKSAEEKVQEIQLKLKESNEDLVRRNKEIQNFYHVLSHELKTPLTSAREFVSMVLEGLAGPLNKTQMEYLGIAKDSCNQLRICINDLLDTTRIETGKLSLEFRSVDLSGVVQRLVKTMQTKAIDHNVQLTFEPTSDLAVIAADEGRITQVVTNLIDNAFKFTPSGGSITAKISEVFGRPDCIQVSVSDTGRGIPKAEQDSIFERLHQVKAGDATKEHGIGLGLYLCRELVWLHGGVIWVNSEIGKGSTFTFMLPKSQKRAQADVLVIDDDTDLLETMKLMLSAEYDVRTAVDGADGLKEITRKLPDMIVMDLSMPNVDGVEILKAIRQNWDSIPVIVYTAYSNGNIMKRAMEYSPFTLLSKPADMNTLLRAVRGNSLGLKKELDGETRIIDKSYVFKAEPLEDNLWQNGHDETPVIEEAETS
jgi:PAS domain S-box-containing protein